ncbi:MAG: hypothetical protein QOH84_3510 [Kribbellaceae bacterium]|nr:hypothetical protein [Kribbellaceae bacterium]
MTLIPTVPEHGGSDPVGCGLQLLSSICPGRPAVGSDPLDTV